MEKMKFHENKRDKANRARLLLFVLLQWVWGQNYVKVDFEINRIYIHTYIVSSFHQACHNHKSGKDAIARSYKVPFAWYTANVRFRVTNDGMVELDGSWNSGIIHIGY